jgi:hypothetical protein
MELVTIKTFDNYFSANILLGRLQHDGVECWLMDEHTVTVDPILTNAIGGIKLTVKKEDAQSVMKLLWQYEAEQMKNLVCPSCSGCHFNYITKKSAVNYITAILTWSFTNYAAAPEYVYQCADCGLETKNLPEISE